MIPLTACTQTRLQREESYAIDRLFGLRLGSVSVCLLLSYQAGFLEEFRREHTLRKERDHWRRIRQFV